MAKLRHPRHGTEIEVDDDAVDSLTSEGWEKADDTHKKRASGKKDSD